MSGSNFAPKKNDWLQAERAASLLRFLLVVIVHLAALAALLSWSWSSAPIEVSILSLEDLGAAMSITEETATPGSVSQEVDAAQAAPQVSPVSAETVPELGSSQQIDIALAPAQSSAPAPNPSTRLSNPLPAAAPDARVSTPPGPAPEAAKLKREPMVAAVSSRADNSASTGRASGDTALSAGAEPMLTAARFDADYLHNPAPSYPTQSRRLKEEGTVLLLVRVSAQGAPISAEVRNSSGFDRLDEAGLQAVRQWRFVPARRGQENVAASVLVPIQFQLKRQ